MAARSAGAAKGSAIQRVLSQIEIPRGGGFESLSSGIEGGHLDAAAINDAVEMIHASADPLPLGVRVDGPAGRDKRDELARRVKTALTAVAAKGPKARLTPVQVNALEAIVRLSGRPALLVKGGTLPVDTIPAGWVDRLAPMMSYLEQTIRAVGRIEIDGIGDPGYIGTGFLVAPTVVMTNAHVAEEFCRKGSIVAGSKPRIDFREEYASVAKAEFPLTELIGIHPKLDLALFSVGSHGTAGAKLARPLRLSRDLSKAGDRSPIYVVGYPASDARNDARQQHRIFNGVYEKKRLAPGRVMKLQAARKRFSHDCTTLGGNSGSCVLELSTSLVVGLHFEGHYRKENVAVLLPALEKDPLIVKAGINYV